MREAAVLLVGHGSSSQTGALATLARHADTLAQSGRFQDVRFATLINGPDPRDVLIGLLGSRLVYIVPMFMSDGYFVRTALPKSIGADSMNARVRICPPIGLSPELPVLCAAIAERARIENGWANDDWDLVIAAHGSVKGPSSRETTESVAAGVRVSSTAKRVVPSYLEEPPYLGDVIEVLDWPTIVLGLFAAEGEHVVTDVPEALDRAMVSIAYTGAVGGDRGISDIILAVLTREMAAETVAA